MCTVYVIFYSTIYPVYELVATLLQEGWGLAWKAQPKVDEFWLPCLAKSTVSSQLRSERVWTPVGETTEDIRRYLFKKTNYRYASFSNSKSRNLQCVFLPFRSFTAALQDSKQRQPLSNALPEVRSPRVRRGLRELLKRMLGCWEEGWFPGPPLWWFRWK